MLKTITHVSSLLLFAVALTVAGCGGQQAGIVTGSADEQAALKAHSEKVQSEYADSMAESNR